MYNDIDHGGLPIVLNLLIRFQVPDCQLQILRGFGLKESTNANSKYLALIRSNDTK